jgi:uncharacterized protein (DUF58 family)
MWYWGYRVTSGWQHWMRRRFTPAGLGLWVALAAVCLLGPDTENNVAYQAVVLLLCLLIFSLVYSCWFRIQFSATRILPRFGTVGSPLSYLVRLRNLGTNAQTGLTLLENLEDPRPRFEEWYRVKVAEEKTIKSFRFNEHRMRASFQPAALKEAPVPSIPPLGESDARVELLPLRRGVLRFSAITLARPDPIGLFRAFARKRSVDSALILPRRYPLPSINLPGAFRFQAGGVALASNVGQSDEFVALRDYRHGDPVRHIHWRSWAKTGKPVIREFEDEFFVRHALVLDTFAENPASDLFEEAVSVAASFACSLVTQESLLDLLFVGTETYCFTAGRGLAGSDQMLEVLASVRTCHERRFADLDKLVIKQMNVVSGVIAVLLNWDHERQGLIKKIRSLGVPVLVLILTTPTLANTIEAGVMKDDPEHFHVLTLGEIEAGLQKLG